MLAMDTVAEVKKCTDKPLGMKFYVSKKARIKHGAGNSPKDVIGFDYVMKDDSGACWSFYMANPPYIGLSHPVIIECPLGVVSFDKYEIDYKKAISIIEQMRCGKDFTAMALSWPLTPDVKEPLWFIRMAIGNEIVIGANTGDIHCYPSIITLYSVWPE